MNRQPVKLSKNGRDVVSFVVVCFVVVLGLFVCSIL